MKFYHICFVFVLVLSLSIQVQAQKLRKVYGKIELKNEQKFKGHFYYNTSDVTLKGPKVVWARPGAKLLLLVGGGRMSIPLIDIAKIIMEDRGKKKGVSLFQVDISFQTSLNKKQISSELRSKFTALNLPLKKPTVLIIRKYLFSTDGALSKGLDQKTIPSSFSNKFREAGFFLSPQATAKILISGREWLIDDGVQKYLLKKEGRQISAYMNRGYQWQIDEAEKSYLVKKEGENLVVYPQTKGVTPTNNSKKPLSTPSGEQAIRITSLGTRTLKTGHYESHLTYTAPSPPKAMIRKKRLLTYTLDKYETGDYDFSRLEKKIEETQLPKKDEEENQPIQFKKKVLEERELLVSTNGAFKLQGFTYTIQRGIQWQRKISGDVVEANLFSLPLNLEAQIRKGPCSIALRKIFKKQRTTLSTRAVIRKVGQASWLLRDSYRLFKIKKERRMVEVQKGKDKVELESLEVYETQLSMVIRTTQRVRKITYLDNGHQKIPKITYENKVTRKKIGVPWKSRYYIKDLVIFKFIIENKLGLNALDTYYVFDPVKMNFAKIYIGLDSRSFLGFKTLVKEKQDKKNFNAVMLKRFLSKYYRIESKIQYAKKAGETVGKHVVEYWWTNRTDLVSPMDKVLWIQDYDRGVTYKSTKYEAHGK